MIVAALLLRANAKFGLPLFVASLGSIGLISIELRSAPTATPKALMEIEQPMPPSSQPIRWLNGAWRIIPFVDQMEERADPVAAGYVVQP